MSNILLATLLTLNFNRLPAVGIARRSISADGPTKCISALPKLVIEKR